MRNQFLEPLIESIEKSVESGELDPQDVPLDEVRDLTRTVVLPNLEQKAYRILGLYVSSDGGIVVEADKPNRASEYYGTTRIFIEIFNDGEVSFIRRNEDLYVVDWSWEALQQNFSDHI